MLRNFDVNLSNFLHLLPGPADWPRASTAASLGGSGTSRHFAWRTRSCASLAATTRLAALKVEYADVLGRAPPGLPPERGMELVIEKGGAPMPRLWPVKRLSEGSWWSCARSWWTSSTAGGSNTRRQGMLHG
jgi:hypothetical protein